MSQGGEMTLTGLAVKLFGIIILILGALLTYFSLKADVGVVNPRLITPVGVAIALIGGFMLLAKEM